MQAIKRLKRRFIALAMVSLTILLAFIVTGMNIMNYNDVVSDADAKLDVLEQNVEKFQKWHENGDKRMGPKPEDFDYTNRPDEEFLFGKGGQGGPRMSMDEAEESRFFTVEVGEDGSVKQINVDRISAVKDEEAEKYAEEAIASGDDNGFVNEFRYSVIKDGSTKRVTFLDCGRVLESFRSFLRASIIMSLIGLALVFAVITFFAGRIIKPVAESYEKQKRFITDAGHEIKTPLAIIKANLDLMDMDVEEIENTTRSENTESLKGSLGDIGDQVDRLADLTNDLVYLSRMEEGNDLVMSELPLSDLIIETVSSFEALAKDNGKSIETDIEPMLTATGSTKELEKLVSILLENAIKYSDATESIRVTLKKDGRNNILELSNRTSDKQESESLTHVFERFYRTDESRNSATGGHGIGLSMASAIVSAHKGRIAARTTDGYDFIVTAVLPQ
ncbi:MAG: HAMP domain-containing histidine kinase [Mogibacterium sp.]|nr:HAMP domain-containing histidine kinase [Mogibacterium sp.]